MTGPDLKTWRTHYGLTQQAAGEFVGFKGKGAGNSWARLERSPKPVPAMLAQLLAYIDTTAQLMAELEALKGHKN